MADAGASRKSFHLTKADDFPDGTQVLVTRRHVDLCTIMAVCLVNLHTSVLEEQAVESYGISQWYTL